MGSSTPALIPPAPFSHAVGEGGNRGEGPLIIGYGNDLRGDDAAGRVAADRIATWDLPGVTVRSVHQLTPELADLLSRAEQALFLDAYPATEEQGVQVIALEPESRQNGVGHFGDPAELLELTRQVYGRAPKAHLIALPALGFDFGAALTPVAAEGVEQALSHVRELLECTK